MPIDIDINHTDINLTTDVIFPLAIVLLWLGCVLTLAAIVKQRGTPEQVRKVVHMGTGNILPIAWLLDFPKWFCVMIGVVFCIITLISYQLPILPVINSVGRRSYGVFFYAVSITVLVTWFWTIDQPQFAVLGVLIMTWADGMAALVGQRWGKHLYTIFGSQKSWEGSLAMAVTSYVVATIVWGSSLGWQFPAFLVAFPIAVTAACLEAISPAGTDNLSVPIVTAALGYAFSMIL